MGSSLTEKPHAVFVPYPAQGHVTPMLKLAKLLHFKGFYVTFVNTDYNHRRLLRSRGWDSLTGIADFQFQSIPDGLPLSNGDITQDVPSLSYSTTKNCLAPFRALLCKINGTPEIPRVSCIVSDGVMSFTLEAAAELHVPEVLFWTTSACGFMCYLHYQHLLQRGITQRSPASYFYKSQKIVSNQYIESEKAERDPEIQRERDRDGFFVNGEASCSSHTISCPRPCNPHVKTSQTPPFQRLLCYLC